MDTTALHDFLETAPDAMLLINAHGNIVHANIQAPLLNELRKHLAPPAALIAAKSNSARKRGARGARRGA